MSKQKIIIIFGLLIFSSFAFSPEIFSQVQITELLDLAYQEEKNGDLENAVELFDRILEIDPKNLDALVGMGGILIMQEKNFESLEYLTDAIKIDPDYSPARTNIAISLAKLNNIPEAERHLDHILEINENDVNALNNKATLETLWKNNVTAGIELLNKVLLIDPKNEDALENKKAIFESMPMTEFDGIIQTVQRDEHGNLIGIFTNNRIFFKPVQFFD